MNPVASFDVETTGLDSNRDKMFAFCIGRIESDHMQVEVYRLDRSESERRRGLLILQNLFDDIRIIKVGHNIKFDLKFAIAAGIRIPPGTIIRDTMIASQILRNLDPSHKLKDIIYRLLGTPRDTERMVQSIAAARGGYHRVPEHIMHKYQIEDGEKPLLLHELFIPKLKALGPKAWEDYENEMALILQTIKMESVGMLLDIGNCRKMIDWLENELHAINKQCFDLFGQIPNLNAHAEVNYILFKKLKLPVVKLTKEGSPSADKDALLKLREKVQHPFIDLVIKQRSYTKGLATVHDYLTRADSNLFLYPNINTNEARTGRQSSERPNLQNVQKASGIKTPFPVMLRKCFRPPPGRILDLADYAAIEFRLIIDRSGESSLIEVLRRGEDPHNLCGAVWYGDWVRPELRWSLRADKGARKPLRDAGKNATFGKGYGAGVPKLAATLNLSIEETLPGFRTFCERWPRVAYFTNISAKKVLECGYVETPFGRRLYVEQDAPHAGANYDIQGTAAGILKRAQVRVGRWLEKNCDDVQMVLPVHDELIFSFPRTRLPEQKEILGEIGKIMTTMEEIQVPLEVEWKQTTTTWADARDLKF